MQVIEAQCASILVPHDHLHISQMRMSLLSRCLAFRYGPCQELISRMISFTSRTIESDMAIDLDP